MPRFNANLSFLFTELPFLERFGAAAAVGFKGVECLFPYDEAPEAIAAALRHAGLELALFNLWPGDWEAGERGLAALPGREADFEASLERARPILEATGCERLHVLAGLPEAGQSPEACEAVFVANLKKAAAFLAPLGAGLTIEPINPRDLPGYFLTRQDQAAAILDRVGADNAGLQMDLYHCQIVEGDLATQVRRHIGRIRHFQIAGVPDRGEPDWGEVNYPYLFDLIDALGYEGWIGCEYRPQGETLAGLGWAAPWGIGPRHAQVSGAER